MSKMRLIITHIGCVLFAARCYAERGYEVACRPSVCPSVCPSLTFRYRDHIGWNFSKIISRPISLIKAHALTDPNMGNLVQRKHPKNTVE